jgi:hypothetical protein
MPLPTHSVERPDLHPDAPAGGGGPGYFRRSLPPGPLGVSWGRAAAVPKNAAESPWKVAWSSFPPTGGPDAEIWAEIATMLCYRDALKHRKIFLEEERGLTPAAAVKRTLDAIRSGINGLPTRENFTGPKLFLRAIGRNKSGRDNSAYEGEWWFESDLLDSLKQAFSRIYFRSADRKAALRDMLRELLAISKEWNDMTEVWALELPPGEMLVGYSGAGSPQKLFGGVPLTEKGNRMLVGKARQIFFPVKNPLWVKIYERLL